ncbi:MAG: phosphate--AMP phosphotransferase, partial [Lachnospiraceae bacterium]|nr:phosphate--AMP phosphotransferase [Lachnospiraceae bacterium]
MLKDFVKEDRPDDEEISSRLSAAREKLAKQQILIKDKKLPVLVVLDGWGAAGKGSVLGKMIKELDPRFFKAETLSAPTETELRRPFLYRYFVRIPEAGKISFFDGSWMDDTTREYLSKQLSDSAYKKRIKSIKRFERQLSDNGYLLVKLFFNISEKEQTSRITALRSDQSTKWRVSKWDKWQNKNYKKCRDVYDKYMEDTNSFSAPWYIVDSKNRKWAQLQAMEFLVQAIDIALSNSKHNAPLLQNTFRLKNMPKLADIPLDKTVTDAEYKTELKALQTELADLHNRLYKEKIPVIIAYEGWDAAGKGGNIKRVAAAL